MERRIEFRNKLSDVTGLQHLYFNPPETIKLEYPCITYQRQNGDSKYADDKLYRYIKSYTVTVIDKNPDSEIPRNIQEAFELCQFERFFVSDNLNHWVLRIYY